jgi:hypothetical protein
MMIQLIAKGLMLALSFGTAPSPHHTMTIPENYPYEFNANGGDQLNVILEPIEIDYRSPQERCEDMGGTFHIDEYSRLQLCFDIDF